MTDAGVGPLNILHVMRAPVGGLFRHVADLARGQSARGHRVGLIADRSTGGAQAEATLSTLASKLAHGVTRVPMSRHVGVSDFLAVRHVSQRARAVAPGDETRAEMSRIMASAVVNGSLSGEQRAYLVQLAAQRAGIPQQEAERRVDQAFNAAREAADKARRAGILTGFVTAASLVLSLGAAWWAAVRGGNHRDNSIPARFVFGDRRRTVTTPNT